MVCRDYLASHIQVQIIESSKIGVSGLGEGGSPNFAAALQHNGINIQEFIQKTGATHKWGFVYDGWRNGQPDDKFYHLFASTKASASQ